MQEEDFDQEEFASDINEELDSSDHLSNFHQYSGDTYKVHNESYENIYEDDIYVEVNYNEAIDGETLILTIQFDTNNPDFRYDEYTIDGYITYEITDALKEMMLDLLDKIYKKDKSLLTKFGKEDLKYLAKKYPEDLYIKSALTGEKYKLFDYASFINEYYLSPDEEESGEVDDFHNYAGEFKDIGEETDESYRFFNALQEELEDFYGEFELISSGESDLKIYLPNYADDSKFIIELDMKGIGSEDTYFYIDFDTENEDYPVLKDTSINTNPKDVIEKLKYLILKRYNEYYLANKHIVKKLPEEIIDKLAIVNPEDPFMISWKGGRKFQMFDYNTFVKESYEISKRK